QCLLAGAPESLRGDARTNYDLTLSFGVRVSLVEAARDLAAELFRADLVIDALLGTGFQGEPRGPIAAAIEALRSGAYRVLAVDVPSGLDADTGKLAQLHVRAQETVTFGLPKVGLALLPGRTAAGQVTVAEISLPRPLLAADALQLEWLDRDRVQPLWPSRAADAHKGASGRLFVLAGSAGMTGAASLTCDAALRAGAGLVTLGIPASLNPILEVKLTEAMTLPLPETESHAHSPESLGQVRPWLDRVGALAIGPGFGRDPRSGELLRAVLRDCPIPVVVDADGLFLVSPAEASTFPERCVITPHPAEMARLLGTETAEVQSNRLEVAKTAAVRLGCVVVLKGPATVVAAPDGRAAINSSGSPALATGGTGDVLTGMVAACLARELEPYEAAVAAVYLHGIAGEIAEERHGAPGAVAGDVVAAIPEALRRLRTGEIPPVCRTM
ncbi:MAG: carbohydrate kinase, YjeF related protein, partial [Armatimonadetes bacterium]|nr:carbohydrate kinase, YjeF related protein [Armatimonadota bacterium]